MVVIIVYCKLEKSFSALSYKLLKRKLSKNRSRAVGYDLELYSNNKI